MNYFQLFVYAVEKILFIATVMFSVTVFIYFFATLFMKVMNALQNWLG